MVTPSASFSAALVVEDFPPLESDDTMEMPPDKYREVFDLAQCGARAFREGRFDEAISFYSKAHNLRSGDPIILSNRSSAFCLISQVLRERSAADSEYQPLNGLDPTTHAELALKDAEKVVTTHGNSPRPYLLKAYALILLERYQEARESLLSGLQVDPPSHILQTCLGDLDRNTNAAARARCPRLDRTDDFECTLCFKLLFEPVTTPCGHTFCRSCLHQSMDHGNKCPMCRTVLFIGPRTYPISVTLSNIIQKNFTEEYAERRSEHENMTYAGIDLMPLFVMDVVLPCQKMALNIFEPRYRLMVRRIMEGNRRMGMVAIDSATGTVADCGCEVEILECEPLPDGRFYLEVEGSRRFRILRSWDEDGSCHARLLRLVGSRRQHARPWVLLWIESRCGCLRSSLDRIAPPHYLLLEHGYCPVPPSIPAATGRRPTLDCSRRLPPSLELAATCAGLPRCPPVADLAATRGIPPLRLWLSLLFGLVSGLSAQAASDSG
ncbi:LON peptidase N-terminal domain and RING finger protein 3 isoform X2 [Hordeum vulgare subsp. vulgare]|uniref:LON peptidase N-terminal domain and RING finger protein 3 isoform X2 n=1 Tax=Hordeum vulgare subsp. vulgare TaxID=112509 RepID=UPI001D1A5256|nr:LON peptidase N-terminal domain and RING finger protein 3 isoform X2 [Hordeum vulgare subsp. vulgare]